MILKNLKNNHWSTLSNEMNDICKPLLEHTKIDYVIYGRFYADNSVFCLETSPGYAEWFLNTKKYKIAKNTVSPKEHQPKPGYYLDDLANYDHPKLTEFKQDKQNIFNFHHDLIVLNSNSAYNEIIDFKTTHKNSSINDWYINNIDLIEKFTAYLKEKASPLILQAEKNRLYLEDANENIGSIRYHREQGLILKENSKSTKINQQYADLTSREKECIYWLFLGKTIPEIALILEISKRTVEKFVATIKEKFACNTLFQLGESLSILRNKLILMEKIKPCKQK
jgi:DNA-binding CsgD family transcriptional regulator